ncbi:hypothetical protein [Bacillus xiapuensis]|uniref:hypothetical protein n=1 Tax=Bacillus xiapuensis TaxID=2014075 RepID=UPI000C245E13|nr:hypothetical protein [Bacillus xiapuensis]
MKINFDKDKITETIQSEMKELKHKLQPCSQLKEQFEQIQEIKKQILQLKEQTNEAIIIRRPHSPSSQTENAAISNASFSEQLSQSITALHQLEGLTAKMMKSRLQLEDQLMQFEKRLLQCPESTGSSKSGQPIIYQEFNINTLYLDKYELTNNLGQLGIKELNGRLYIGAVNGPASAAEQTKAPPAESGEQNSQTPPKKENS